MNLCNTCTLHFFYLPSVTLGTRSKLLLAKLASFNVGDEGAQGRAGDTTLTWGTDWGTAGGRAEDDVPEETLPTPSGDEQLNLLCLEFPVGK